MLVAEELQKAVIPAAVSPESLELLHGLRRIAGRPRSLRPQSAPQRHVLMAGCSISERANSRAAGAYAAPLADGGSPESPGSPRTVRGASGLEEAGFALEEATERELQVRYQELMKGIEKAMSGAPVSCSVLRPREVVDVMLEASSQLYYAVPLPQRKAEVTLYITRVSGIASLYASARPKVWPTARHHDLAATGGVKSLLYHHSADSEDSPTSLHLCVDAGDEVCEVRLRCAVHFLEEVYDEGRSENGDGPNCTGRPTNLQNRVEKKLELLRQDPGARQAFDEHLQAVKERGKRKKGHLTKNFRAINKAVVHVYGQEERQEQLQAMAERKAQRYDLVTRRRVEVEQAQEERKLWWVSRDELLRQRREVETRKVEVLQMQSEWFQRLLVVSFAMNLYNLAMNSRQHQRQVRARVRACVTIQKWVILYLTSKRKMALYLHVIKLRTAVAAHARHTRLAIADLAQPCLKWFLTEHTMDEDELTARNRVLTSFRSFLTKVRQVQDGYRRLLRMRKARREALKGRFLAERLVHEEVRVAAAMSAAVHAPEGPPPGGRPNKRAAVGSRLNVVPEGGRAGSRLANKAAGRADDTNFDDLRFFERDFAKKGTELLPEFIRSHVIRQHVVEMQLSFPKRMKTFMKRRRQEIEIEKDLASMGMTDLQDQSDPTRRRPRVLELERLPGLYADTYDAYCKGEYKHFIHNRKRIQSQVWDVWVKVTHRLNVSKEPTGPAPELDRDLHIRESFARRSYKGERLQPAKAEKLGVPIIKPRKGLMKDLQTVL
mmetsp:Transcript_41178/g.87721  ORF Transcript_41178/g.87721 Transcript_41178/m.87721 type:complete len:777 (-) Transcript_41178:73-2403(-)